jgi:protein disulfide-isomerase A1
MTRLTRTSEDSEALEPEWLAMQEKERDDNIVSFDCQAHSKFCSELDVTSFPAIGLYHRDGRMD